MTNYLATLAAVAALSASACSAADTSTPKPTAGKPAAAAKPAAATVSAAPAGTSTPAPAGVPRYVQAPAGSSLTFSFVQAGAENKGTFKQFATELAFDEKNPAASSLKVTVQMGSFDTQDKDRDETLASADMLDPKKFPTAVYVASSFAKDTKGFVAVGKLTLHGVTKDLRIPLAIATSPTGATISGETAIKRLEFGVGGGDWKSTESVGDEIKLVYKVALVKAPG